MEILKAFFSDIVNETNGFGFGEPWRPGPEYIVALVPITRQIRRQRDYIIKKHNGKGYVCIMQSNILLGVHWAEKELPSEHKDNFRKRGRLILSPEEITELTNKLAEKVDSGQFAQAVDWINRYEPSVSNNQVGIG